MISTDKISEHDNYVEYKDGYDTYLDEYTNVLNYKLSSLDRNKYNREVGLCYNIIDGRYTDISNSILGRVHKPNLGKLHMNKSADDYIYRRRMNPILEEIYNEVKSLYIEGSDQMHMLTSLHMTMNDVMCMDYSLWKDIYNSLREDKYNIEQAKKNIEKEK